MTQIQESLFGLQQADDTKPVSDVAVEMKVLITVKAAPNPSATHGETVCVAGIRIDLDHPGWIRLYPINFRDLDSSQSFAKYSIVRVRARPARGDPRIESWRPEIPSLQVERKLRPWAPRRQFVDPYVQDSMCDVLAAVKACPPASSLALVRPRRVLDVVTKPHSGWNTSEQAKIDGYVAQLDIDGSDRSALEPPRLKGWYRYYCHSDRCRSHNQGILDWEWVALQRRLDGLSDADLSEALRSKFLGEICAAERDVAFYVGNQAKRAHTFSVLGIYYPKR